MIHLYHFIRIFLLSLIFGNLSAANISEKKIPKSCEVTLNRLRISATKHIIVVSVIDQMLTLYQNGSAIVTYPVSTAKAGVGSSFGSYRTPSGLHRIAAKIGSNKEKYAVFRYQRHTGKYWNPASGDRSGDLILSRILRLTGLERGKNLGHNKKGEEVDSDARRIYIHGTNQEHLIGSAASHGCIRMLNDDVIDLYKRVPEGTLVWIDELAPEYEQEAH